MKKALAIALTLLMLIGMVAGCTPAPVTPAEPAAAPEAESPAAEPAEEPAPAAEPAAEEAAPQKGGTLKFGVMSEATHTLLNFKLTGSQPDYVQTWPIYEGLFRPNDSDGVDPYLLESFEQDPAAKTYTFHLRKGVTFSDGSVFNAEVCKWNLDYYLEVGAKRQSLLGDIESVNIIDEYTVQLQLTNWNSIIPYALSRECGYMCSKVAFDTYGPEYLETNPVGTGPFVLESWEQDVMKRFVRNENYWNGEVYLDAVEYIIYNDSLVAQAAMQSGEIDALHGFFFTIAKELRNSGINVVSPKVTDHVSLLCFNSIDPTDPCSDLKVRQALCYGIDMDAVVKAAYGDFATHVNQFCCGSFYYNDQIVGYEYDVEKAKALLAEAGYPNGFETVLTTENDEISIACVTIIQQYLAELGVTAELKFTSGAETTAAEANWGHGMWYHCSSNYVSVPMQMMSMFRQNLSGHVLGLETMQRPDDVHEALTNAVTATTEDEAAEQIKIANKSLIDDNCLFYPAAEYAIPYAVSERVKDSGIGASFYSVATLGTAWLAD